ncbi:putative disease resistance protein RGA3 [Dioscorea cayenensis subsp. rotundata]|uniref:Disease resistance protein RGA3 n=1 Tax=Dioscorea cayennensis subsp. rotundata TaxID=55577 RepID=A0AB40AI40_DIOCR|nr:putative disease resistance protein RGA3 [Dioscorea cayenensis subsp. rotundata]
MAGAAVVSAFLQILFEKLAVAALDEYQSLRNAKKEFQYLSNTLSSIQDLLEDAEEKQLKDKPVRGWLVKLKDVAVDIDDLLDKNKTAVQRSKLKNQKASRYLSCYFFNKVFLDYKLAHKIKGINERLDKISRERNVLGLQVLNNHASRLEIEEKPQTSSLVDDSRVFGREQDKENIVKLLLATGDGFNNHFNVPILPVVGMGGLGKTTLTQLVYNDNRVKEHFQLRMWLCVSENFDERKLTRETLECTLSDYSNTNTNTTNLNLLQEDLFQKLKGKKFLLVLDDVWNENREKWSRYYAALAAGERGSKILMTTRNENVGLIMGALKPYYLNQLSDEDCWLLFRSCAFVNGSSSGHPKLEIIGKMIVKKLKGLPLAAKTLGSLLYSKLDEDEWENILRSEIWELPTDQNNIMPALRLSYKHLPPNLKQCFAFCSVFHKDYVFGRDDLVHMWMALGFIQHQGRKRMEDVGYSYFDELVSRSFFQAQKGNYVMHDAIHDLAQSISIGECVRLEDKLQNDMTDKALHSSFSCSHTMHTSFVPFYRFNRLRTLLLLQGYKSSTGLIPDDLFMRLKFLRVLDLNRRDIDELPNSIGNLDQLRYLGLSGTGIRALPSSISKLYNLQTLRLKHCNELSRLPRGITGLVNLRHLEANRLLISEIAGIGKLTCLQKLGEFNVRQRMGFHITELKDMTELRGHLCISDLENVISGEEAREAMLNAKASLTSLELIWSEEIHVASLEECIQVEVLRYLQPQNEIRELSIKGYSGFLFPDWLGSSSLSSLHTIHLSNCKNSKFLPPLGQLPFLRYLDIGGMDSVTHIGQEFLGFEGFPSLIELVLEDMPCLEEWVIAQGEGVFPCITEIQIRECPELRELPQLPPTLMKLTVLEAGVSCLPQLKTAISSSSSSSSSAAAAAALSYMYIHDCPNLTSLRNGLLSQELKSLRELTIANCEELVSLPMDLFKPLVSLKNLHIYNCPKVSCSFQEATGLLPASLEDLRISSCSVELINPMLKCLGSLTTLRHLKICDYSELNYFPKETRLPDMLKLLTLCNCANLLCLPPLLHVSGLETLVISDCPLAMLPVDGLPAELQELHIDGCPVLKNLLEQDDGREWAKIVHVPKVVIDSERRTITGNTSKHI